MKYWMETQLLEVCGNWVCLSQTLERSYHYSEAGPRTVLVPNLAEEWAFNSSLNPVTHSSIHPIHSLSHIRYLKSVFVPGCFKKKTILMHASFPPTFGWMKAQGWLLRVPQGTCLSLLSSWMGARRKMTSFYNEIGESGVLLSSWFQC